MDTATKPAPIYRYRVVVKDGKATVERRAMRWSRTSFYGSAPRLLPIRDFSSHDHPEAETEQGAIEAARAALQQRAERWETTAREATEKAQAERAKLAPIDALAVRS